ncbi:MAG TPA: hypothetical protein VEC56_01410 [Candidatus Krumholzibacteria bacterium]|nr:hypothetical protein [Candidatus Krumholzibacteria bacterium]
MSVAVVVPVDSTDAPVDSIETSVGAPYDSLESISTTSVEERISKFTLGAGGGRYYREVYPFGTECSSTQVPFEQEYADVGFEFDHQASRTGHLGVRAGYISGDATLATGAILDGTVDATTIVGERSTWYVNPYFSVEKKGFGIGAGGMLSSNPLLLSGQEDYPVDDDVSLYPTGHVRLGSLSQFYISGHLLEGVPVYSGGGALMAGAGLRMFPSLELYAAYCAEGPYQNEAWLGRVTIDLHRSWVLMTTLRFPTSYQLEPDDEYGMSFGLSYRWYRPGE